MATKVQENEEAEAPAAAEGTDGPLLDLVGCRRQEDDQGRQKARLRHHRPIEPGPAVGIDLRRADRGHHVDALRDGHQRHRGRGRRGAGRIRRGGGERGRRARRAPVHRRRPRHHRARADRPHRRSRPHVPARDGLGRASLPRGRNRHRQAHRGRPRDHDRGPLRIPAHLPGDHHLARRAGGGEDSPPRHHRSRSHLRRARGQERAHPGALPAGKRRPPGAVPDAGAAAGRSRRQARRRAADRAGR